MSQAHAELLRLKKELQQNIADLHNMSEGCRDVSSGELLSAFAARCTQLDHALDELTEMALQHSEAKGSA